MKSTIQIFMDELRMVCGNEEQLGRPGGLLAGVILKLVDATEERLDELKERPTE